MNTDLCIFTPSRGADFRSAEHCHVPRYTILRKRKGKERSKSLCIHMFFLQALFLCLMMRMSLQTWIECFIYIYIKPRREKKEKTMRILYKHETSRKKLKWLVNTCMIYDYLFILNQIKCRSFLWMHVNISNEKLKKIRYVVVNCRIKNERLAHNCKLLDIKYPQDAS